MNRKYNQETKQFEYFATRAEAESAMQEGNDGTLNDGIPRRVHQRAWVRYERQSAVETGHWDGDHWVQPMDAPQDHVSPDIATEGWGWMCQG